MRAGWISTALKNACAVDKGKHNGESLPYVGLEHIESGTGRFIGSLEPTSVKSATFRFTPSHVLYGRLRPYLNKVLLPDFDGHCSSEIFPLRVKSNLDRQFLYYWLTWEPVVQEIDKTSTGARMPRANVSKLLEFEIPLPPLPEQKRIVAILDEAFAGIATAVDNTEKNLANARELFENYLNSVFSQRGEGWEVKRVEEVAEHCLGKMLDKQKNKGTLKPYLRNINVRWFEVDTSDMLQMRIEDHEVSRYSVQKGDLLICEGGYPGRAALWERSEAAFFQKALHRVRCSDPRYNRWILYYLYFQDSVGALRKYFTGAGIQHLTGKALANLPIIWPPVTQLDGLLAGISGWQEEVTRLDGIYTQKLAALAELKQSLLQKAFSGELTAVHQDEIETALA